jgi:surface polysaccharide O-acyltransferase-like enzyme
MSLFFLISGYFMVGAWQRHTAGQFVRSRLVRLGIPVLAFVAIMIPSRLFMFGEKITRWDAWFDAGHLWYLEHVLLFSLVYAVWQLARKRFSRAEARNTTTGGAPGFLPTIACLLGVAVASLLIRAWSPIDTWRNLLGFFKVAFADVPRDLTFFVIGAMAYSRGWLKSYPTRKGIAWLAAGVLAAAAWYVWVLVGGGKGLGKTAFALAYPVWEAVVCFGMCIGLLVLFRELGNGQRALGRFLAANQYSAYFWHPMIVVPIQMAILALPLGPAYKFLLVTAVGVPLVFGWSWLVRRIRAVRAVL